MVVERPSDKVLYATIVALVTALALQMVDGPLPADWQGWVQLVARAIVASGLVGSVGYMKTETNSARGAR